MSQPNIEVMIRTWMKIAKQYNFKLTKSETKLWFK